VLGFTCLDDHFGGARRRFPLRQNFTMRCYLIETLHRAYKRQRYIKPLHETSAFTGAVCDTFHGIGASTGTILAGKCLESNSIKLCTPSLNDVVGRILADFTISLCGQPIIRSLDSSQQAVSATDGWCIPYRDTGTFLHKMARKLIHNAGNTALFSRHYAT